MKIHDLYYETVIGNIFPDHIIVHLSLITSALVDLAKENKNARFPTQLHLLNHFPMY